MKSNWKKEFVVSAGDAFWCGAVVLSYWLPVWMALVVAVAALVFVFRGRRSPVKHGVKFGWGVDRD